MGLNLEGLDVEPATPTADPPATETPPTPPAAPASPPIEGGAAAAPAVPPAAPAAEPAKAHELVPLATHLEQRKALNARIAELEAAAAARAAPPAAPPAPVDFMENPQGYVDQKIQPVIAKAEATEAELRAYRERDQINALINEAGVAEVAFAKDHPDYQAALDHVRATRLAQLRLMDSEAPEAQLQQVIAREEIMGIAAAKQRGISPAELAYRYAQTLGYRTPAPAAPAAPAPPAAPAVPAADVSAARSLGAGGGGGDSGGEEESELTSALKARFRR